MKKAVLLFVWAIIFVLGACLVDTIFIYVHEDSTAISETTFTPDTIISQPEFMSKSADESLREALEFYDIQHPDIVCAQAILETGYFKSVGCVKYNNLFGLYNSKAKRYCRFNHWSESVVAYKEWIQQRYKPQEDYYDFLARINYASDSMYISKLKQIVKKEYDKRRYTERDTFPRRV